MRLRFLLALALAATTAAHAQRGGGPPHGGGMPGGGPGGMNGGMMGQPPPRDGGDGNGPGGRHGEFGHGHGGPQLGPPGRWWDDKHVAKNLNLTSEQQHKMDNIFEANKGQLISAFENLKSEEQKVSAMTPQDLQDESKVFASIDRVAQARAELEKQNAHILVQIRHELDNQQLAALDKEIANR